jgi:hypothetical protein
MPHDEVGGDRVVRRPRRLVDGQLDLVIAVVVANRLDHTRDAEWSEPHVERIRRRDGRRALLDGRAAGVDPVEADHGVAVVVPERARVVHGWVSSPW